MLDALLKGLALGFLLSISVGPIIFSIIKQSLNNGHPGGMAFVFGVSVSDISLVLVSNVFTELFSYLIQHKQVIGVVGSLFLILMGLYYIFLKKIKVNDGGIQIVANSRGELLKIFLSGFLMNTLNPAIFLFWLTASTTLITHSVNHRVVAFVTCLVFVLATDILKVMMAQKIRKKLTPHNIQLMSRLNGIILLGFGIVLLWGLLVFIDNL